MKAEWQVKALGEVCEVINGGTPKTGVDEYWGNEHLWITPAEMGKRASPYVNDTERKITSQGLKNSSARLLPPNSVILSSRAPIGHLIINTKPMATNQGCKGLVPNDGLAHKYLFYFLMANIDLLNDLGSGATFKELSGGKLKEVKIPLAPPSEQQRIVAILDQAFEGIAKARANAEQNLKNARALFESHLQSLFTQRGKGWSENVLKDICEKITDGTHQTPKYFDDGVIFLSSRNVTTGKIDWENIKYIDQKQHWEMQRRVSPKLNDILLAKNGTTGVAAIVDRDVPFDIYVSLALLRPLPVITPKLLLYFVNSSVAKQQFNKRLKGVGVPNLHLEEIREVEICFPRALSEQEKITTELDNLLKETQRLEVLYQRKIGCLDELKKSLLQKAFSGELTLDLQPNVVIHVTTKQQKLMSSTDLYAGILVLAYQKHEDKGNVINFGHVKAEKIAHMLEAKLGIDLGRAPIKAAAGPNDYPHLKIVESRARKAGFFDFKQIDGAAYHVVKLSKFDDLADKTRAFLAEKMPEIDELLELMLPMDTQQAEIFSTVYAAWNNLLLEGQEPTDENIVFEARENWHPDKLKIPRKKFFAAIDWMRNKKVLPEGKGKKVLAKK